MNNDLISRSALKKALKPNCDTCSDKNTNWCEHCCPLNDFEDLIDNAPAVEAVPLEHHNKIKGILDNEVKSLVDILDKGRPQGEWIFQKANEEQTDGYECSNCKACFHTKVPYFSEFNFCPNCGADMRGGAE